MTTAEYEVEASRTDTKDYGAVVTRMIDPNTDLGNPGMIDCAMPNESVLQLLHGAMGINTESGELMDAVKRLLIYGKPIDHVNIKEEIGDLMWYVALVCRSCGFTIEQAMQANIAKLRARYPEKFTEALALGRNVENERKVLEGDWGTVKPEDR